MYIYAVALKAAAPHCVHGQATGLIVTRDQQMSNTSNCYC